MIFNKQVTAERFENQWGKIAFLLKWIKFRSIYCQTMDYDLYNLFNQYLQDSVDPSISPDRL